MASADTQKLNNRRRRDHPRRETLPGGTVSRTHTRQLDFYQAMSDFKHMFPSMEEDVIEAILRANDGAVDATIDQLLTMSVDTDDISCVRKHTPLSKRHTISGISPNSTKIQDSPPSYSEAMRLQHSSPLAGSHGATLPMTWRHSSLQQLPPTPPRGPHKRSLSACGNLLDIDLPNLSLSPNLSLPSSNTIPKTFYGHPNKPISTPSGRVYRNWNPPMLGTLPDDFLRLNLPIRLQRNSTPPPPPPPLSHKHSSPTRSLDANLNSTPQRKSYRPSKTMIISTHEFSKSMLEQKLKENERRRRSTSQDIDPELTQYLADEHLAIVIQNSEFLQELRGNEDFMKTLEKDIEGYGHDNQETLEAFPFSQPLPSSSVDEDAELRSQLKHMGRASRKQFVTLARKFFSRRKKKSSRDILGEKIAPSMTNLLEDEEQPEDDLPAAFLEDRPVFEPLPDTLPMNRTNQRFSQAMSNHTLNRRSDIV
ncbi:domain-containing 1-like [Octopus vulgaris]|uniref:Domain-containing 1-like n=1 Tax=Octopus vulgaris TaxID=6645 RepID=A0AA36EVI4_OCTVU|nr:domain-containing 1-like [Octopus vulgaris]